MRLKNESGQYYGPCFPSDKILHLDERQIEAVAKWYMSLNHKEPDDWEEVSSSSSVTFEITQGSICDSVIARCDEQSLNITIDDNNELVCNYV